MIRRDCLRRERQLLRVDGSAGDFGASDARGCVDGRQVLSEQAVRLAPRANSLDAKRLARNKRKRERRAKYLPAAFPE